MARTWRCRYQYWVISGYRLMWVLVMFDLPVLTRRDRKNYKDFHDFLQGDGYARIQLSFYARPCATEEHAEKHLRRVVAKLPPAGQVRILKFTDKQWMRTLVFYGTLRREPEQKPDQLTFFDAMPGAPATIEPDRADGGLDFFD